MHDCEVKRIASSKQIQKPGAVATGQTLIFRLSIAIPHYKNNCLWCSLRVRPVATAPGSVSVAHHNTSQCQTEPLPLVDTSLQKARLSLGYNHAATGLALKTAPGL